jgi:CRP-like cAMP-binding protein
MSDRPANAFLRNLGAPAFDLLQPRLQPVSMPLGEVLYREGDRVDWIYFPLTCLLSVLTTDENGDSVETAMVGNEGALGLLEACGSGRIATTCLVQIDGRALRIGAADFRTQVLAHEDLARAAWTLIEMQLGESRQSGMCVALHTVEQRLARWLLESAERVGDQGVMPLTQEFIGSMLGVQRTTVTAFASQLQKAGLIRYARGRVEIVDAEGLEARACECRAATREQRRRLRLEPLPIAASAVRLVKS